MGFPQILKEMRLEKGFTQKQLAQLLNLSSNIVCEWEKGRCEPSIDTLKRLSTLFDCSIDYLVGEENNNLITQNFSLPNNEQALLDNFRKLPEDLQERARMYMQKLVELLNEETKNTFPTKNTHSEHATGKKTS